MTFEPSNGSAANPTIKFLLVCVALLTLSLAPLSAIAKGGSGTSGTLQRYIIELQDPPLATYDGRELSVASRGGHRRLAATAVHITRERKLNTRSSQALAYLEFVSTRHEEFRHEASLLLGRPITPVHLYRMATNGLALDLSNEEATILAKSPLLKSLAGDTRHRLDTFAGPEWIGAGEIWTGDAGFPETLGEGIIVGMIDTGINWEHRSFDNPSPDGYIHTNPLGERLGLCNDPGSGAECNDKLIGVYDFVQDDPFTEDVVEENTNGRDNDGHGSHTASTAAGNPVDTLLDGQSSVTLSGVAPRANIISFRVCYAGEPVGPDSSGCMGSAILSAIDQAVSDGVDVINYSIGNPNPDDPWRSGSVARAYLNARESGIFVATSAGNEGPAEGTISSPANAPWVMAVGNSTHNVLPGSSVKSLVGGGSTQPDELFGASLTGGSGQRQIVHARDYGNALCGVGDAELQASCDQNQGLSNPWQGQTPFNGEIVVCDRGTFGRVEKGKNLLLAGAGGYILANTDGQGESIVADDHCLPATHVGDKDGDILRTWLASGSGHGGTITGFSLVEQDSFGDQLSQSSSRGPGLPPVEDILKPNVSAPGTSIVAASSQGQAFIPLSGTSMSSPHVAGAGALLKSVHPDWSVSQIASAIETTATAELATDGGVDAATANERGAGRPQLAEAANAGLSLDVTISDFINANPAAGGQPRDLNLSGLVDSRCQGECSFVRRVTDQVGGGNWTATAVGFPNGVSAMVNPANFTLGNGQSRELEIDIDLSQFGRIGEWVSGSIRLSSGGLPDQFLTVSVKVNGGSLPVGWTLTDDRNGGWQELELSGLSAMPDATYSSGELIKPGKANLFQDPTDDDPYDGGVGVFTTWHSLPEGGLWLYAQTLASTAVDLDLFVGRDDNNNGMAEEFEELCSSTSPGELEFCNIYDPPPGNYWIVAQNWLATEISGDLATVAHAAIAPSEENNFAVSGPGITSEGEKIPVRLSWDNVNTLPGEQFFAAAAVGTSRETPGNIGFIPVVFNRSGIAEPETFPLTNGSTHRLAIDASDFHDRLFIDVPPGTSNLTVFANGADEAQNNGLTLELKRLGFEEALINPPFATPAAGSPTIESSTGVGGVGPSITVIGVESGRWYPVLTNNNNSPSAIELSANAAFQGAPVAAQPGLWEPNSRPGLGQGYEYNQGGSSRALIWYTYDEDGQPTWYIAGNPATKGNIWTAELLRFTNNGTDQQSTPVGQVSITSLAENDAMFSYTLFGQSGTERMQPISPLTCPQISGSRASYTGIWFPGVDGLGGASVLVSANTQAQIHYLFDDSGMPRWLFAQDLVNPEPTNSELPMFQFSGYCAVCEAAAVSSVSAGVLERSFNSETAGNWTLDYLLNSPLSGSVNRTDPIIKLTDTLGCQ
jgi:subtilisin family serine protease